MIRRILLASLTFIVCASHAQIYKWTDGQGVVHFSDTPHPGAQTINNPDVQGYSTPPPSPSQDVTSSVVQTEDTDSKKKHTYEAVTIVEPADQVTIRNPQGYVVVKAEVDPKLFSGDGVQVLVDDKAQGAPQKALTFQLSGIYRGSHTIAVQVVNAEGEVLKTSAAITVFMQQPRVGMVHKSAS